MSVKILCAGCSKEEREQAEADVRKALAERATGDNWMVSLVKLSGRWSVTLDAPAARLRGLTVVAPEGRLVESIRDALGAGAAPAVAPSPSPAGSRGGASAPAPRSAPAHPAVPPAAGKSGVRLQCEKCGGGFTVVYEAHPGEPQEAAPVACPHCWHVNRILIGVDAAFNRDYRAEKA
jgi:DNA-directed RNA polymerase subunit RPC12/RpoP